MDYLPEGYEELKTSKNYVNISKLTEGEHRFRIVQRPIAGWIDWNDKKPYRYLPTAKPAHPFDAANPIRAFWACYVWDYAKSGLYIMEITQSTILKSLAQFGKDSDWGDFTKYDIKISKEGSGKETKYHVSPVPHKELSESITQNLLESPVRLEALYDGGDPWECTSESSGPAKKSVDAKSIKYLDDLIGTDTGLRDNITTFLKKETGSEKLEDMPEEMYEKMVSRALRSKQDSEQNDVAIRKNHKITQTELTTTIDDIFGGTVDDVVVNSALPF
jgi:hypothetical protein